MDKSWKTRRSQLLLSRVARLVLVLAVLPNVLSIGHLPLPGLNAEAHVHTAAEAREHANHCHGSPASCGDQPSFVGTSWVFNDDIPITRQGDTHEVETNGFVIALDSPAFADTPPPRIS